jgi:4-amino-4-deoxy-L-arabinose transferase-like glycosyltransferase
MQKNKRRGIMITWAKRHWWQFTVPGLYFVGMFLFYPFRNAFWMNQDEGINLIKAQLLLNGYSLYSDIWSDQPPVFTYLLATLFRVFGLRVNAGRVLVLLMACGLFFLYLNYLYNVWGKWHALVGIVLLVLLPGFTNLSVSVMIGLPSIVFAMLSLLTLVYWHNGRRYFWLVVSALGLGISMNIKLFTGFLAPIFLLGILFNEYARYRDFKNWRNILLPGILWG